jgi:hypothetical protein
MADARKPSQFDAGWGGKTVMLAFAKAECLQRYAGALPHLRRQPERSPDYSSILFIAFARLR